MFVIYFLIKVEITLLNNVNLTDCFTSTLRLHMHMHIGWPSLKNGLF